MVFKPGESGLPGGDRNKTRRQQSEKLLPHVEDAVATLVAALGAEESSVRVQAARDILDRVYGKPQQSVEHDATDNVLKIIIEKVKQNAGS